MASPADRTRLRRGIAANAISTVLRILSQLILLPVLFAFWDEARVGVWLMIFALPAYLCMAAAGVSAAGANRALAETHCGDGGEPAAIYRSARAAALLSTLILSFAAIAIGLLVVERDVDLQTSVSAEEVRAALILLGIYALVTAQMTVLEIPLRYAGRYPEHIWLQAGASAAEVVALAILLAVGSDFAILVGGLVAVRLAFTIGGMMIARSAIPAMFARSGGARQAGLLRSLAAPSLAFIAMPLVYGLNLQGYVLLVGAIFGPAVLAAFVATRTIVRLLDLFTNFVFNAQFFEAGHLSGDESELRRRLLTTTTLVTLCVSLAFAAVVLVVGPPLQHAWTVGKTEFSYGLALVLLAAGTIRALSAAPIAILSAMNAHARVAGFYLAGSGAGIAGAFVLAFAGAPLSVVAAMLIAAELSQLVPLLRSSVRATGYSLPALCRDLFAKERLADIAIVGRLIDPRKTH
ncbi:hypothetical protein [Qipengyuania atrilutea]|nr:hypothetical protein [Actirhodobacter atriluteus]